MITSLWRAVKIYSERSIYYKGQPVRFFGMRIGFYPAHSIVCGIRDYTVVTIHCGKGKSPGDRRSISALICKHPMMFLAACFYIATELDIKSGFRDE